MTVQAPHWPRSQPFLVPVRSRCSRRRSSRVTRGSSSRIVLRTPFTVRVVEKAMQSSIRGDVRQIRWPQQRSEVQSLDGKRALAILRDDLSLDWSAFARFKCYLWAWLVAIYGGLLRFSRGRIWTIGMRPLAKEKATRRPRADAIRNRERILEAANTGVSARGSDPSLEAVARAAGVGIGTLYRHFPTREALFEAVYRHEVEQLAKLADSLAQEEAEPVEALRRWLHANVHFVATKKGMLAALELAAYGASELYAYSSDRLTK